MSSGELTMIIVATACALSGSWLIRWGEVAQAAAIQAQKHRSRRVVTRAGERQKSIGWPLFVVGLACGVYALIGILAL